MFSLAAVRGTAAAVALLLAIGVDAGLKPATPPVPRAVAQNDDALPRAVAPAASESPSKYETTLEIRPMLDARAKAIMAGDRHRFALTVDPTQFGFRDAQLRMFDALRGVPLASWSYEILARDAMDVPRGAAAQYRGEVFGAQVTTRYQLAGFDDQPAVATDYLTFHHDGTRWRVASDSDFAAQGYQSSRALWHFGPVEAVRGQRSLVLGHPGSRAMMRTLAAEADAAVPRVSRVWGTDWSQRVVVLVPADQKELGALLGDRGDLSQIAAVAIAELPGPIDARRKSIGNRVLVNTPNFRNLSRLGRRIVMTHEVTHVATRDDSGGAVPPWLVEGFADYVGYLDTGLSVRVIGRELRADLRAGRLPRELPGQDEFKGTNQKLAEAYELAWLATRYVESRLGRAGLVRFYRELGSALVADTEAYSRTLREMLGMSPDQFTRAWTAYVRAQLA